MAAAEYWLMWTSIRRPHIFQSWLFLDTSGRKIGGNVMNIYGIFTV
jgi:hypothetical protein